MLIICSCGRTVDIDIAHAGKTFRCPHCGEKTRVPGVAVSIARPVRIVATAWEQSAADQHPIIPHQRFQKWFRPITIAALLVLMLLGVTSRYLVRSTEEPNVQPVIVQVEAPSADLKRQIEHLQATLSDVQRELQATKEARVVVHVQEDASPKHEAIPLRPSLSYKQKAPIDMTQEEWRLTLQDRGLFPDWWFQWPYDQEQPWSRSYDCQERLFKERQTLERLGAISKDQDIALRTSVAQRAQKHIPFDPGNPFDLADLFLKDARSAADRASMDRYLNEAMKHVAKSLRRGY